MEAGAQDVLKRIDPAQLRQLVVDMVNVPSPTGQEKEMAQFMVNEYEKLGLKTIIQEVEDGRPNAIGIMKGSGGGASLLFDGHLDTSFAGTEAFIGSGVSAPKARYDDEWIYGMGAFNMKSALAAYLVVAKAIKDAGIQLKGDLTIASVVGEIEKTEVDRYQGAQYRGYGRGSSYMVSHGVTAEFAILGEPTGLKLMLGHYGTAWAKVTTYGEVIHTAWSRGKPNAIEKMVSIIEAIKKWKGDFENRMTYRGMKGIVNIGSIEGGWPWRASRTPGTCSLYVDIRIPPGTPPSTAKAELESALDPLKKNDPELQYDVELYVAKPGTEISQDEYLVKSIRKAHKSIIGAEPEVTYEHWYSDAPTLKQAGITAINYGPAGASRREGLTLSDQDREYINLDDLVNCTKIYALTALDICSQPSATVRKTR